MARLIASVSFLEPLPDDMRRSFTHLDGLMVESNIEPIQFLCAGIKEDMGASLLSQWFALLVRTVFRYTHEGDGKFNVLLGAIKQINKDTEKNLTELRRVGLEQYGQLFQTLGELQQRQTRLMTASFYPTSDGKSILERDKELKDQIANLQKQTNPTLALFLIVEKIIKSLQRRKAVSKEIAISIKGEISQNPLRFMVKLIPVLVLLQKAEENDLGEIIRQVLQLINIDDAQLAASVQKELFKKGWLKITVKVEPDEEHQTTGCFSGFTRAVSQLFFKRRNRNRVSPQIQAQIANPQEEEEKDDISFSDSPPPEDGDGPLLSYVSNATFYKPVTVTRTFGRIRSFQIPDTIDEQEEPVEEGPNAERPSLKKNL